MPAAAEVLSVPAAPTDETAKAAEVAVPTRGQTMTQVESGHGAPSKKRPTVGGDTPKHPPITRWDYPAFSVIFERDRVVDVVVHGAPPKLYETEALEPVAVAPAPEPVSEPEPMLEPEPEAPVPPPVAPAIDPAQDTAFEAEPMADEAGFAEPEPEAPPAAYEAKPEPVKPLPSAKSVDQLPEAKFSTEDDAAEDEEFADW